MASGSVSTSSDNQTLQDRIMDLERQLAEAHAALLAFTSSAGMDALRRFELLSGHSRDIILFIRRADGRILESNAAATSLYGYSRAELLALTVHDLRAPGTLGLAADQMAKADAEGILFETIHRRKDGSTFPVEVSSQGATVGGMRTLISVVRDISERKQAEAERERLVAQVQQEKIEAQQRTQELNAIIDALYDPVMVYDREGLIYRANAGAVRAHGFDPSHSHRNETNRKLVIRHPDGRIVDPEYLPSARALQGETVISERLDITNAQGQELTVLVTSTPLIVNGVQTGAVSVWHDITEQRQAEQALHEVHERAAWLARLPEENPNPVARVSADGLVLYHNPAAGKLPGWMCVIDRPLPDLLLPLVEQAMAQGHELEQDMQMAGKFYSISVMPFPAEAYANLYGRDITGRKLAERALQESRQRIDDILRSISDGFFALDRAWSVIYVNKLAAQIAGLPADQMMGKNLWELWPRLVGTPIEKYYRQVMEVGVPAHFRTQGLYSTRWYDVSVYSSNEGISVFYVDKTAQIEAEQALRESELRFRQLAGAMPQLVWTARPDGTVDYYNHRYQEYDGITSDLDGDWQWAPALHPDDLQTTVEAWQRSIATGEIYQVEHRVRMAGGSFRWHLSRGVPVLDEQGRITRWFGTATDIHDQKLAEENLRVYAEKLEQSNRDLQEFAYVASHDLQEPLRKIEAFGDSLLQSETNLKERERDYVERMRKAAGRMRDMVDGLLQLSRVTTQGRPFVRVDLSQVAAEVLSDLDYQIRRTAGQVEVGELPVVEGDPLQLRQLLQNLIGNALKFHRPNTSPWVKVYARRLSKSVQILVEDNGIGFDQGMVERMFQPFQRMVGRSEYDGSGMGLAICRRIVERHGGEITARSEKGQGATFIVTLRI